MYNRLKRHLAAHRVSARQLPDKIFHDGQLSVGHIADFVPHFTEKLQYCAYFSCIID